MKKPHTCAAEAADLLSSLSDELLHKILFSLPAKEAGATCILSSRWRYLWAISPDLFIDSQDFFISNEDDDGDDTLANFRRCTNYLKFVKFVDRALLRRKHDAPIRTFSLSTYHVRTAAADVDAWVRYAIERGVRVLDLVVNNTGKFGLPIPGNNFVLTSLQKLHIQNFMRSVLLWPESLRLPSLTHLGLTGLKFDKIGKDSIFKSCPQLRSLKIIDCIRVRQLDVVDCPLLEEVELVSLSDLEECNLHSDKLRSLVIHCCYEGTLKIRSIKVNAPNLKRFKWKGKPLYLFSFAQQSPSLPCLDFASFHRSRNVSDKYPISWEDCMMSLVRFTNAKQLVIDDAVGIFYMVKVKNQNQQDFAFTNIQHIEITLCLQLQQFEALYFLLRSSPSLQTLTVKSMDEFKNKDINAQGSFQIIGEFWETLSLSMSNLSEVKYENFRGTIFEMHFVEFLLGSANALRTMDVQLSKDVMQNGGKEVAKRIKKFEIVSSRCHVFIY